MAKSLVITRNKKISNKLTIITQISHILSSITIMIWMSFILNWIKTLINLRKKRDRDQIHCIKLAGKNMIQDLEGSKLIMRWMVKVSNLLIFKKMIHLVTRFNKPNKEELPRRRKDLVWLIKRNLNIFLMKWLSKS